MSAHSINVQRYASWPRVAFSLAKPYAINMSIIATRTWICMRPIRAAYERPEPTANTLQRVDLCAVCVPTIHTYIISVAVQQQVQMSSKKEFDAIPLAMPPPHITHAGCAELFNFAFDRKLSRMWRQRGKKASTSCIYVYAMAETHEWIIVKQPANASFQWFLLDSSACTHTRSHI